MLRYNFVNRLDWQPELFGEYQPAARPPWWARAWRVPHRIIMLRVAYEDLVLAGVGALMLTVLSFCLGVERGKRLAEAPARPAVPIMEPVVVPAMPAPPMPPGLVVPKLGGGVSTPAAGRYAVQVASFLDRPAADAANAKLIQRGFQATIVTKGKYLVLYAEGFATYAGAADAVNRLRGTYRDCFVRKLLADRRG